MSDGYGEIFISYSSNDRKFVERLAKALTNCGCDIWWDQKLLPGHDFQQDIPDALKRSQYVITVFSPNSIQSKWVLAEASYAQQAKKILIPVVFCFTDIPVPFNNLHVANLEGWLEYTGDPRFLKLLKSLNAKPKESPFEPSKSPPNANFLINNSVKEKKNNKGCSVVLSIAWSIALLPSVIYLLFQLYGPQPELGNGIQYDLAANDWHTGTEFSQDSRLPHNGLKENIPILVAIPWGRFEFSIVPSHIMLVDEFFMTQTEITFDQYNKYAKAVGVALPDNMALIKGTHPVVNVSASEAQKYALWLSNEIALNCRLPSEIEWEYAARAGATTQYFWGDEIGINNANCDGCGDLSGKGVSPVASYQANALGLYDMHGSVWEWVQNPWRTNYIGDSSNKVPLNEERGGKYQVVRGGAWNNSPELLSSGSRWLVPQDYRSQSIGFRVACSRD